MVVQIHIYSFAQSFILPICRIAVPIFFMITGYFMVGDNGVIELPRLKKSFAKLLKITIWAQLIWIFFTALCSFKSFNQYLVRMESFSFWLKFIYYGNTFGFMLWYLNILIESLLVIMLAVKYRMTSYLWLFIPIGFTLNLLLGSYSFLWHKGWLNGMIHRNLLTIGLPCICLGIFIRKFNHRLPSVRQSGMFAMLALIILTIESEVLSYTGVYDGKGGDIIISTVPLAVCIFVFFLRIHIPHWLNWTANMGRRHSLNIYIFHKIVEIVLFTAIGTSLYFIGGIIVAILSLFLSMILVWIKEKAILPLRITNFLLPF